ncbi:hypothetical protein MMSR116_04300 [Methylobacterium mesophilicum SR1.6/6]|uniref:DUF6894 domain-containing protein n=1 Tax=Methylobacterium mesophilicum SR1.6/6 TaxID=908290 RepID=A0A6B9FD74_9HYPH|nr:hypothetical protein [Methylobacterium mesophilicum]QGY01210.1 hypothetical protein MMSR116_04300 [Methylobacterium mesophilicum SR1.6/6]
MGARRYRFHCTDGRDAVFDLSGRLVQRERDLRGFAEQAARALMRGGDAHDAWVGWAVDVYDPLGRRRMTLPFADVPREGR